jgi:phosphoribosylformylglycinamidine cyclo-ligase
LVAEACSKFDTIGIDCVAMNVNDIICVGAEPLAMVDYLALEKPQSRLVGDIMKGLQYGARQAGIAIVAGETAIVPDLVNGFDLSGTAVGLVRKNRIIAGDRVKPGDVILGLPSNGIHSNGLTLARKTLLTRRADQRIARELLRPTRIYVSEISKLLSSGLEIHGLAHITGGAYSKLKRIGLKAKVGFHLNNLPKPPWIFRKIQDSARISDREMYRTFNMGIGFLVICPKGDAKLVRRLLPQVRQIGFATNSTEVTVLREGKHLSVESY